MAVTPQDQERARAIAGDCLEKPRAALDDGVIKDDCLTELKSKATAMCDTCATAAEIYSLLTAVIEEQRERDAQIVEVEIACVEKGHGDYHADLTAIAAAIRGGSHE